MWVTGYNWVTDGSDRGPEDVGLVTCRITVRSGDAAKILELIGFIDSGAPIPSRDFSPRIQHDPLRPFSSRAIPQNPPRTPIASQQPSVTPAQDASPSDYPDSPTRFSFLEID